MKTIKKYIKISNKGEIDINAFRLIGASTKRDASDKIGFFGSGLKYSIAFLLRNEIEFTCFAGKTKIEFTTQQKQFRDETFHVIYINGQETSMTTSMGADWKTWFVIREIYCNAIDEGEEDIATTNEMDCEAGKTIFYIKINEQVSELINSWDDYFSLHRKDLVYSDKDNNKLFAGGDKCIIYRRGIRCAGRDEKSIFHYDMQWAKINESRTIENDWNYNWTLCMYLQRLTDKKIIKRILRHVLKTWEKRLCWDSNSECFSDEWLDCIDDRYIVNEDTAGMFKEEMELFSHIILPKTLCDGLKDRFGDEIKLMGEMDGAGRKKGMLKITPTSKQKYLLIEVEKFLEDIKYSVRYPIEICGFENNEVLGLADNDVIYLSERLFDMGRREIAAVIIEENEHHITGFEDESRNFQNHFINKYLAEMEERQGYFL